MDARGTYLVGLVMGLMGLLMAYCVGLQGVLDGRTKSSDHPSRVVNAKYPTRHVAGMAVAGGSGACREQSLTLAAILRLKPWALSLDS